MTTTPPEQLLTNEQIDKINCDLWASCPLDLPQGRVFARAIERALLAKLREQQPVANALGLLPCPFCGSSKVGWASEHDADGFGVYHSIECQDCCGSGAQHYVSTGNDCPQHRQEVRDSWNKRAAPVPAPAQAAQAVPAWTQVHDALPSAGEDEDIPVWTWDGTTVCEDTYGSTYEQPAGPAVGGWVCTGFAFLADIDGRVTHWMPRHKPAAPTPTGAGDDSNGGA